MSTRAFAAWQLAGLTLPNRFVKAATFEGRTQGGEPSESLVAFHAGIARGGTALTTVAYCAVAPDARTFPDQIVVNEATMPGLRRLAGSVHEAGGLVSAQLAHAGSFSRLKRPLGQRSRGPSVTINDYGLLAGEPIAGAMRPQDFDAVVAQYAATAVRLMTAGFDALEIHMGHGYLLSQFISPATNRRTDAYGGSLVNRMRLPLRVLEAVRAAVGDDMPLIAKLNLDDGLPGGVHVNNSIEACNMLGAGVINAVELSGGFVSRSPMYLFRGESPLPEMIRNEPSAIFRFFFRLAGPKLFPSMPFEPLYFLEQARRVRQAVDVPLIYLGGVSSGDDVRRVLDEEGFDAVALGRTLLHDAGFVERLRADARAASGCTHCNRCVGLLDAPGGIRCTLVQG